MDDDRTVILSGVSRWGSRLFVGMVVKPLGPRATHEDDEKEPHEDDEKEPHEDDEKEPH